MTNENSPAPYATSLHLLTGSLPCLPAVTLPLRRRHPNCDRSTTTLSSLSHTCACPSHPEHACADDPQCSRRGPRSRQRRQDSKLRMVFLEARCPNLV